MEQPLQLINLSIQGMTCAGCVSSVEKALGNVDGVDLAQVNFALNRASVHYNPEFANSSKRSEERRVGKECRSRWSPYH